MLTNSSASCKLLTHKISLKSVPNFLKSILNFFNYLAYKKTFLQCFAEHPAIISHQHSPKVHLWNTFGRGGLSWSDLQKGQLPTESSGGSSSCCCSLTYPPLQLTNTVVGTNRNFTPVHRSGQSPHRFLSTAYNNNSITSIKSHQQQHCHKNQWLIFHVTDKLAWHYYNQSLGK